MTEQNQAQSQSSFGGNLNLNVRDLEPGDRFRAMSGGVVEVVMNPKDGLWVLVRYIEPPEGEPDKADTEDMLYVDGVGELISRAST